MSFFLRTVHQALKPCFRASWKRWRKSAVRKASCRLSFRSAIHLTLTALSCIRRSTALFLAQVYGIDLSIGQQLTFILVLMVTSKGMAAVPGTSFVVLLATLGTIGVPAEGLAFIAGVDRIMDMARTVVNLTGNALAAVVMSKWEGEYDAVKGQTVLNQREPADMKMSG